MNYRDQLKTPQWKRLAAKLKDEADWKCEECGREQSPRIEIQVHHTHYIQGLKAWEHPRCVLMVLCDECHVKRNEVEQLIYTAVADIMRRKTIKELKEQPIYAFFSEGFTITKSERQ